MQDNFEVGLLTMYFFYLSGLFYCYDKVSSAAKRIAPILEDLEARHLSRFNLTWELLNKAVYYQVVYNDTVIANKLPEMIGMVSDKVCINCNLKKKKFCMFVLSWLNLFICYITTILQSPEVQDMMRFYMAFDDEMSIIQAMWRESYELLQKYK